MFSLSLITQCITLFVGRLFPEFRYRRPPPSYTTSMHEYEAALSNLRNQGLIPQTPPPQYKVRASVRRTGVQIVYPLNPHDPHSLPPAYRETLRSNSSTITTDSMTPQDVDIGGIENPVFECHLEDIAVVPSNTEINIRSRETNSKDNQRGTLIHNNTQGQESSHSEVTHL